MRDDLFSKNWPRLLVCAALLGLSFLAFNHYFTPLKAKEITVQKSQIVMDTVVEVRVDAPNAEELVEEVFVLMGELESVFSRFLPTSEISRINGEAGSWVQVSSLTMELLKRSLAVGELSQGAFDFTIGALSDLWGFGSGKQQLPPQPELAAALEKVDYQKVELDFENHLVRVPVGSVLDLGGVAKGFVIEKAVEFLRAAGVRRAIINGGGDIAVLGNRPDGTPWRVGVQDPLQPSDLRWILPLEDRCIVTSGDYQRYFISEGERWHHILDPKSGYPARGLRSVTVVGNDLVACDALATAIFVLGPERGKQLVLELEGVEAILVSQEDQWISPGLVDSLISP